ncbi:helix-turn-helix domain-containing protein [Dactylosporangium sp. CA-052675]|uniref:helix-turn-helix transcriptional regulator n=1 Tax=Dactylosporangium sp. CA-052675 TaxID=3239927 RepID=UPI003D926008
MDTAEFGYAERASRLRGAVVWRHRAREDSSKRILPDGCMDVIHSPGGLIVAGPDTVAHLAGVPAGSRSAAVRFAPGQGPAVLGVPAHEVRDQRIPLDALWPSARVRRLTERLDEAPDPGAVLESELLAADRAPDPLAPRLLARLRAGRTVAGIAADVGLSERQLHRRGLRLYGYGLKTLARILRLGVALDLARAGVAFATVAVNSGYADQAHLARDVKALAGVTMQELVHGSGPRR